MIMISRFPSDVAVGNSAGLGDGIRCIIRPRGHSRNDHYMFVFDTTIYNIAILAHSYPGHQEHRVCLKYVNIVAHATQLGTGRATKTDEFSENFQRRSFSIQKFVLQILDLYIGP